jgi:hypothetical protein
MEIMAENITPDPQVRQPEPKMDDIGSRYQHLLDYRDSIELCMELVKQRGNPLSLAKFAVALEVLNTTIDAFSGYGDTKTEYSLYRLLNSIPSTKEGLTAIGGTPLE